MEFGKLSCPKCGELRMDNYDYWFTRKNSLNQIQWLFYREINVKRGWRCWALLTSWNSKLPKRWYDPCGCCFNPCKGTIHETKYIGPYGNEYTHTDAGIVCFCIFLKWMILYMIYNMIFCFYIFIFCWYDIYYCYFKEQIFYEVYTPNGVLQIRDTEDLRFSYSIPFEGFTEEFWNAYGKNIFRCNKCSFIANSFKDFIGNENGEVIIKNHLANAESKINIISTNINYNNLMGTQINVHFISADKSINLIIPCFSKEMFSNVLKKIFGFYPNLKDKICTFTCNGKPMEPNLTLEQNNYQTGNVILITISQQN